MVAVTLAWIYFPQNITGVSAVYSSWESLQDFPDKKKVSQVLSLSNQLSWVCCFILSHVLMQKDKYENNHENE